jgi:hypothetical protein
MGDFRMQYWIFQGNKESFDIDTYLSTESYIYWSIVKKKHQKELNVGDRVFVWRAKGKSNYPYGIVAHGVVEEGSTHKSKVRHPKKLREELWKVPPRTEFRVGLSIEKPRLSAREGLVDANLLRNVHLLRNMQIISARQGTNFSVTRDQYQCIHSFWGGSGWDSEEENYSTEEGKAVLRLHKWRERDSELVKRAKTQFFKKHGALFCEACTLNFEDRYGDLGIDFIEAHHNKPLSKLKAGEKTKISDLVMLCSNCHRMIHKMKNEASLNGLREILRKTEK